MQRNELAKQTLSRAFKEGRLQAGNFRCCAVAVLLEEALGYSTASWSTALVCHLYGMEVPEGDYSIEYYADKLGYSVEELLEIEGAFEGVPMTPGIRRVSMGRNESLHVRLERVFWVLDSLERQKVAQNLSKAI